MHGPDEIALLGAALHDPRVAAGLLSAVGDGEYEYGEAQRLSGWLRGWLAGGGDVGDEQLPQMSASARDAGLASAFALAWTEPTTAGAVGWYVERVRVGSYRNTVATIARQLATIAASKAESATRADVQAAVADALVPLADQPGRRGSQRIGEAWQAERAERARAAAEGRVYDPTMSTGLDALDEALDGGLRRGSVVVIGGRPGMGKSALALQIAIEVAMQGTGVAYYSMEMSAADLDLRAIAYLSHVPAGRVRRDDLTTEEAEAVIEAETVLKSVPLFIFDRQGVTVGEVISQTRVLRASEDLGLVVIDHFGLLNHGKVDPSRPGVALGMSSGRLREASRALDVCFLELSQMNRGIERRTGDPKGETWLDQMPRPSLSDLRESGDLEQDAHVVMYPLRPTKEFLTKSNAKEAAVDIVKNRNGPMDLVHMAWDGPCTSFRPIAANNVYLTE